MKKITLLQKRKSYLVPFYLFSLWSSLSPLLCELQFNCWTMVSVVTAVRGRWRVFPGAWREGHTVMEGPSPAAPLAALARHFITMWKGHFQWLPHYSPAQSVLWQAPALSLSIHPLSPFSSLHFLERRDVPRLHQPLAPQGDPYCYFDPSVAHFSSTLFWHPLFSGRGPLCCSCCKWCHLCRRAIVSGGWFNPVSLVKAWCVL